MGQDRSIEEYWKQKEAEYGESLQYKSIAQLLARDNRSYIGILFLMDRNLHFEYTTSQRKTVLDLLIGRFQREKEDETKSIAIPREDIVSSFIIPVRIGRKFLKNDSTTEKDLLAYNEAKHYRYSDFLSRVISGTSLCIVTVSSFFIFQTPKDKKWLDYLS